MGIQTTTLSAIDADNMNFYLTKFKKKNTRLNLPPFSTSRRVEHFSVSFTKLIEGRFMQNIPT